MAKSKKVAVEKTAKAPKEKTARVQKLGHNLPKGFTAISGGGNTVVWEEGVVVTGIVQEVKEITLKNVRKGQKPTARLMRIKTKEGEMAVWEKAALVGLFDKVKKGNAIYIECIGMGEAKKGQNAPYLFNAGMK